MIGPLITFCCFAEFLVCSLQLLRPSFDQNEFNIGIRHFSPFSKLMSSLSPFEYIHYGASMIDFVRYFSFSHFLKSLQILRLSWLNFCFPRLPCSLNSVLYTSSIAPRMIYGTIFWICYLPQFIACFILASVTLLISFDVWLMSLGARLSRPFIAVLTVSLPA